MTGPAGREAAEQIAADQSEVADAVEDLVTGALLGRSKRVVDDAFLTEDQQVLCRGSFAEALGFECLDFALQNERPREGDFLRK